MSTTATSSPPHPLSESGHGVMITHFRGILADALEPGDLPKGKVGRNAKGDDGALPGRQALDQERQPITALAARRGVVGRRKRVLGDLVERDRALAAPGALEATGLIERDATEPTPE